MGTPKRKVVIASRNEDKVRELGAVMEGLPFEIVPASDYPDLPDVIEDGTSIEGNASRKALVTAVHTGEIAIADDTSLQVRELNGLPDIFAARFAGPEATYDDNCDLLLELLDGVPRGSRQARFATACVWIDPQPPATPGPVQPPAKARWMHNPWAGTGTATAAEFDRQIDREEVWERYATALRADLVSWGHDRGRAREVADRLLAAAAEARAGEPPAGSVRLPDPRIWVIGKGAGEDPPDLPAPAGLPDDAPGRVGGAARFLQITAVGKLVGRVAAEKVGFGGFGYDPVFVPEDDERTLAELEPEAKNELSHRGRALRRLLTAARAAYGAAG